MYDEPEKCTKCGKVTDDLTCVDEVTFVCEHCLGDYDQCDVCGEYWDSSVVDMHELDDGRIVCDNCIDSVEEEDEEEDDDDV